MKNYRVLMQDTHNGQKFNFAIFVDAESPYKAIDLANIEFHRSGARVAEIPKEV